MLIVVLMFGVLMWVAIIVIMVHITLVSGIIASVFTKICHYTSTHSNVHESLTSVMWLFTVSPSLMYKFIELGGCSLRKLLN